MAKIIAIANQKGGVGKTTTALAVANNLIHKKKRVLFLDTDPQRNSSTIYGAQMEDVATLYDIFFAGYKATDCIQHTKYGDIIASDEALHSADVKIDPGPRMYLYIKNALNEVKNDYDYIIVDTPPRTGILLGNVLMATDEIIVPVTCDLFGIQGILDFYKTIEEYQISNENLHIMGLLKIRYKGRQVLTQSIDENILPDYAKQMKTKVFDIPIRESVKCQEAQTMRIPLFDYDKNCTTAQDYDKFVKKEILKGGK